MARPDPRLVHQHLLEAALERRVPSRRACGTRPAWWRRCSAARLARERRLEHIADDPSRLSALPAPTMVCISSIKTE